MEQVAQPQLLQAGVEGVGRLAKGRKVILLHPCVFSIKTSLMRYTGRRMSDFMAHGVGRRGVRPQRLQQLLLPAAEDGADLLDGRDDHLVPPQPALGRRLAFGRIVVSEVKVHNMLAISV